MMMNTRRATGGLGSRRAFVTLACAIAWMACAVTHASAATYTCTAQCGSATTSQCGSGNTLSLSTACSASHNTYEGCTATMCDAACATATEAKVETVTYESKSYKCFNKENSMHMMPANAIEQSVSMNCGPGSHTMTENGMTMYMAGANHTACDWSISPAGAHASATAVFAVAAACALMLA
jgi:hypothetical protein